jgi:3-methyladenine DNA glycosylase AlkD
MNKENDLEYIITLLKNNRNEKNREGMQHFGINSENALGIPLPFLRNLARDYKKNHELAMQLWKQDIHETKILATMIDDPAKVTSAQMEDWVKEFDSWDICDQCCSNLFDKTSFVDKKIQSWINCKGEFVKRAGFVLMACLSVHDKKRGDEDFLPYFDSIVLHSTDNRNFVRKAVNWALRQIGKRNLFLRDQALIVAENLMNSDNATARWIGGDAYRELTNAKILNRLKEKIKI